MTWLVGIYFLIPDVHCISPDLRQIFWSPNQNQPNQQSIENSAWLITSFQTPRRKTHKVLRHIHSFTETCKHKCFMIIVSNQTIIHTILEFNRTIVLITSYLQSSVLKSWPTLNSLMKN